MFETYCTNPLFVDHRLFDCDSVDIASIPMHVPSKQWNLKINSKESYNLALSVASHQ
jgi:hypothetical protein